MDLDAALDECGLSGWKPKLQEHGFNTIQDLKFLDFEDVGEIGVTVFSDKVKFKISKEHQRYSCGSIDGLAFTDLELWRICWFSDHVLLIRSATAHGWQTIESNVKERALVLRTA